MVVIYFPRYCLIASADQVPLAFMNCMFGWWAVILHPNFIKEFPKGKPDVLLSNILLGNC